MPLLALGISHHTAPVEIREKVAIPPEQYQGYVQRLLVLNGVEEAVILSTCNRTEIYCLCSFAAEDDVLKWMHEAHGLPPGQLAGHFYRHSGPSAVRHIMRVASGLDSMVLGEPQILGQVKEAWQAAQQARGAGRVLGRLLQHTLATAKSIRTHSGIGAHPVSVAYTAVSLARQLFGDLSQQNVVLIGAGDMIRLCGKHLQEQGISRLEIVNRSLAAAEQLAAEFSARATTLDRLPEVLPRADILISSTGSAAPLIDEAAVKAALRKRRHRPMFMVDIAVPRDIHPDVRHLEDVYLFTIDDLQQVVDENQQQRQSAADSASIEVDHSVDSFMRWLYGIRAARSLKRIRARSHEHESELVEKALNRLQAGNDPGQVLAHLANSLTNRILHEPTQRLREAAEEQRYEILRAADWIFRGSGTVADDTPPEQENE